MADVEQAPIAPEGNPPRFAPVYCGVCSLPPEYCEFQPSVAKCKDWLEQADNKIFAGLELTDKQQKTTEKHEAKQARLMEKKMQSKVLIKRIERGKRKYVTGVFGLEVFGIEYGRSNIWQG
jgi:hypothetical protein